MLENANVDGEHFKMKTVFKCIRINVDVASIKTTAELFCVSEQQQLCFDTELIHVFERIKSVNDSVTLS